MTAIKWVKVGRTVDGMLLRNVSTESIGSSIHEYVEGSRGWDQLAIAIFR